MTKTGMRAKEMSRGVAMVKVRSSSLTNQPMRESGKRGLDMVSASSMLLISQFTKECGLMTSSTGQENTGSAMAMF